MGSSSSKQSNTMPTGSTVSTPQLPSYMQPYVADVLSRGQGDGARTTGVDTTNRNQTIQGTNFQTQAEYLQNMRQLMSQHQQLQNMPNQKLSYQPLQNMPNQKLSYQPYTPYKDQRIAGNHFPALFTSGQTAAQQGILGLQPAGQFNTATQFDTQAGLAGLGAYQPAPNVQAPQLSQYTMGPAQEVSSRMLAQAPANAFSGVPQQASQGTNFQTQAEYLQNMRQLMSQHQQLQNMPNQSDGARTTGVDTTNRNQTIPDISGGYGGGPALQPAQPAQPPQPPMSLRAMLAQAPANAFRGVPQQASRGIFNSQNPLEARGLGALQRSSFMKAPK
jgi:hypothetical protein